MRKLEGGKVHAHKGLDDKLNLTGGTLTGTLTTADINIAYNKKIGISYSATNSDLYNYFYGNSVFNLRVGEWTGSTINVFNIETNGGNKALSVTNITGNVGIGIDLPSQKLHVVGNILATGTVTAPTFIGALTGNASTATTLETTRTIWGQSFNGSANVTGALTGATTIAASTSVTTPKVDFCSCGVVVGASGYGNPIQT